LEPRKKTRRLRKKPTSFAPSGTPKRKQESLVVDEEYRRRGIAKSLVAVLFDAFKQKRIDLMTLSAPAVEKDAMKLYEKLGLSLEAIFSGRDQSVAIGRL
jgi:GNAT superfamily N-acetyltransferase